MELLQILIFAAALSVEKQPLRRVDQMDQVDKMDSKKVKSSIRSIRSIWSIQSSSGVFDNRCNSCLF